MILKVFKCLDKMLVRIGLKEKAKKIYYMYEDIVEGGVVKQNCILQNAYRGKRCFILCTGTSLDMIDIPMLANECTYGCGILYKHKDYNNIPLTFYADPDPIRNWHTKDIAIQYYSDNKRLNKELLSKWDGKSLAAPFYSNLDSRTTNPDTIFFLRAVSKKFFEKRNIFSGRRIHYVKPLMPMNKAPAQSNDLTKRITLMDGSLYFAIASSIYMGFSELYLCGCGYTYQPLQSGHFYDSVMKLDHAPVDNRHNIMKKFADEHGVKIFNVVPDGFESPVYEKVTWNHVLNNVLKKNDQPRDTYGSYKQKDQGNYRAGQTA